MFLKIVHSPACKGKTHSQDDILEANQVSVKQYTGLSHEIHYLTGIDNRLPYKTSELANIGYYAILSVGIDRQRNQEHIAVTNCEIYVMNDSGKTIQSFIIKDMPLKDEPGTRTGPPLLLSKWSKHMRKKYEADLNGFVIGKTVSVDGEDHNEVYRIVDLHTDRSFRYILEHLKTKKRRTVGLFEEGLDYVDHIDPVD